MTYALWHFFGFAVGMPDSWIEGYRLKAVSVLPGPVSDIYCEFNALENAGFQEKEQAVPMSGSRSDVSLSI